MTAASSQRPGYIGRFAPSPTGPLHFGSLVAALASYLDARAHGGEWLVRMEDLDPPREEPGAADAIITSLEAHGLHWDRRILYQSQRADAYAEVLAHLDAAGLVYPCYCSRKSVRAAGGVYPGTCRPDHGITSILDSLPQNDKPAAVRIKTSALPGTLGSTSPGVNFQDVILGPQERDLPKEVGDFIVRRKDRLIAYQLAVVVDDIAQGITHVIRGSDLLDSTAQQVFLFAVLGASPPVYGHIPVAVNHKGEKLSKQRGAAALDDSNASANLLRALQFLGQIVSPDLQEADCQQLLSWAVDRWDRERIPRDIA